MPGTFEVGGTYVGGKPRYKGRRQKPPVVDGRVRRPRSYTRVAPDVMAKTLEGAIREVVDSQTVIMTDENAAYTGIGAEFAGGQKSVTDSVKQYVNGDGHTNTIEGVFSLVKRGIYGVYQNVSKQHLHRHLSEFDCRWNSQQVSDGERTLAAIKGAVGKRLMYREPVELSFAENQGD